MAVLRQIRQHVDNWNEVNTFISLDFNGSRLCFFCGLVVPVNSKCRLMIFNNTLQITK